jgi:hypothetical protein
MHRPHGPVRPMSPVFGAPISRISLFAVRVVRFIRVELASIAPGEGDLLAPFGARGFNVISGSCRSIGADLGELLSPVDGHAGVGHQFAGGKVCWRATMEYVPRDIGGEETQPQHPGEVGTA